MKRPGAQLVTVLAVSFMTQSGWADPVTWYLHDVVFDDGGTATGWFEYIETEGAPGELFIQTTGGAGGFSAQTYRYWNSSMGDVTATTGPSSGPAVQVAGDSVFAMEFLQSLSESDEPVDLRDTSREGLCKQASCLNIVGPTGVGGTDDSARYVVSGFVSTER